MERYLFGMLMFGAGVLAALQPPVNAALARRTNSLTATVVSFAVGTIALLAVTLARSDLALAGVRGAPWWQLTGGLLGAVFVFSTVVFLPRLGATGLIASVLAGQLAGGVLIDRFGVTGVPVIGLTWSRMAGLLLLLAGGALVLRR
jgi:bacterial/archaeal transporter family-2 protein